MKVQDELLVSEPPSDRGADPAAPDEMEEAARLVSDLTVLLDAGLIEVHEHVLGPVRYGVA